MMIVDRIEGDYAIIEADREHIDINLNLLPEDIKEGDIIFFENGTYTINQQQTNERKERIRTLQNSLWKKSDK